MRKYTYSAITDKVQSNCISLRADQPPFQQFKHIHNYQAASCGQYCNGHHTDASRQTYCRRQPQAGSRRESLDDVPSNKNEAGLEESYPAYDLGSHTRGIKRYIWPIAPTKPYWLITMIRAAPSPTRA